MKQQGAKTLFAPFLFYDFHPDCSCATMARTRVDEAPMTSVRTTQTHFLLSRCRIVPFLLLVIAWGFGGPIVHAEPPIRSVPSYEKSLSVPAAVAKVRPSVVTILTRGMPTTPTQAQSGSGSGVIIDESGYILTNNHLVAGIKSLVVGLSTGRLTPAVSSPVTSCLIWPSSRLRRWIWFPPHSTLLRRLRLVNQSSQSATPSLSREARPSRLVLSAR